MMQNLNNENHDVIPLHPAFQSIKSNERIQALDVVRGFALIGIFLMNVEFFNRSIGEIGMGVPAGLTGYNWLASYFVAYFVAGKFWTIFSLLFGMGFAVMLTRAESKQQDFLRPYSRRIIVLMLLGIFHHIFIWPGDILYSYSIGAIGLLLIFFGRGLWIFLAAIALGAISLIPGLQDVGGVFFVLIIVGIMAFLLRSETLVNVSFARLPIASCVLLAIACVMILIGILGFFIPVMHDARYPTLFFSAIVLLLSFLLAKYHQPVMARLWRIGAGTYLLMFCMMAIVTGIEYFYPFHDAGVSTVKTTKVEHVNSSTAPADKASTSVVATQNAAVSSASVSKSTEKVEKTRAEKRAERKLDAAKEMKKQLDDGKAEVVILTTGKYLEAVKWRAQHFAKHWASDMSLISLIISLFLIGFWFVRSGVIERSHEYLPLFRKFAYLGLPFGITLGIAGSLIAVSPTVGANNDGFQFATSLLYIGNLPACIGYVSLIVLLVNSRGVFSKIRVLAPFGRMALTNYLMQSVICSAMFYGYGLGYWGMGRAAQLGFVLLVACLQIMLSHWWLSRFRYGPVEWLWRAATYWQLPRLRID